MPTATPLSTRLSAGAVLRSRPNGRPAKMVTPAMKPRRVVDARSTLSPLLVGELVKASLTYSSGSGHAGSSGPDQVRQATVSRMTQSAALDKPDVRLMLNKV